MPAGYVLFNNPVSRVHRAVNGTVYLNMVIGGLARVCGGSGRGLISGTVSEFIQKLSIKEPGLLVCGPGF